jgi:hypothetical protein
MAEYLIEFSGVLRGVLAVHGWELGHIELYIVRTTILIPNDVGHAREIFHIEFVICTAKSTAAQRRKNQIVAGRVSEV